MPTTQPPPLGFVLTLLRADAGWRQGELAQALGIPASLLSAYESGDKPLSRERLDELVAPLGREPEAVDLALFLVKTLRQEPAEPPGSPFELDAAERRTFRRAAALGGRLAATAILAELAGARRLVRLREERARAERLLPRLQRLQRADQLLLLEGTDEYRSWALAELACEASVRAAAQQASRAQALAGLALAIAERVEGSAAWRSRVQGYAWAFVGNARRVASDLDGAERAFATARPLWDAGAAADPGVLDPSRLLDLEASLQRARRRFAAAIELLDRALPLAPSAERAGSILLKKAFTCEQEGDVATAIAALEQAAPLLDARRTPRLVWAHRLNLGVGLCHLGRYREAQPLAAEARELAVALRNEIDLLRVVWLEARIAAGLGRRDAAIAALRQVRQDFADRGMAYDVALATIDLAVLLLEEGCAAEVRGLAGEMLPIFGSLRVPREALMALQVFWQAVERQEATAEAGRRLLRLLERARHELGSRLDAAGDERDVFPRRSR